ncbi:partitioning defective 3 homolog isoform X2 [Lampetra fluviatilis]
MKVTVRFGRTRVVLPCGDGSQRVRDAVTEAVRRYRKALGKDSSYWVQVQHLEHKDGGILDDDDLLRDVCDDKDKLIAIYEEQEPQLGGGGDCTSTSSTGTQSPDMFGSEVEPPGHAAATAAFNEIEVTPSALRATTPLHVRRSSDPALAGSASELVQPGLTVVGDGGRRPQTHWSTTNLHQPAEPPPTQNSTGGGSEGGLGPMGEGHLPGFQRDLSRSSVGLTHPIVEKWLERQEAVENGEKEEGSGHKRDEIVKPTSRAATPHPRDFKKLVEVVNDGGPLGIHVVPFLTKSGRSLGLRIRTIEEGSRTQREGALRQHDCITRINGTRLTDTSFEESQKAFRDALKSSVLRLWVVHGEKREHYEQVMQLWGNQESEQIDSDSAEDIDEDYEDEGPPSFKVPPPVAPKPTTKPVAGLSGRKQEPPSGAGANAKVTPKSLLIAPARRMPIPAAFLAATDANSGTASSAQPIPAETQQHKPPAQVPRKIPGPRSATGSTFGGDTTSAQLASPTKAPVKADLKLQQATAAVAAAVSAAVASRIPMASSSMAAPAATPNVAYTTKKVDKKIPIHLKKGLDGLGFTIATRDTPVGGRTPIYVKSIMPKGAALSDGRLKSGDRLLEVNGLDVTSRTQEEVVAILRSTKLGGSVDLLVSRHHDVSLSPDDPPERPQVGSAAEEEDRLLSPDGSREFLTLHIPLHDMGAASLGVSVKGTKDRRTNADLGIFIKTIIAGGAAAKDGRLRVDDQLIAVNRESLLGRSNLEAMESLRCAMSRDAGDPSLIQLVVARSLGKPGPTEAESHAPGSAGNTAEVNERRVSATQSPVAAPDQGPVDKSAKPASTGAWQGTTERDDLGGQERKAPQARSDPWEPGTSSTQGQLDPALAFQREGFGRQSVSEKRTVQYGDPSHLEVLKARKSKSMDMSSSDGSVGPALGLKMSSSLESLQTAVAAEGGRAEFLFHRPRPPRLIRGRGCNASFRAAIDKSYDTPQDGSDDDDDEDDEEEEDAMDTVEEEEEDPEEAAKGLGDGVSGAPTGLPVPSGSAKTKRSSPRSKDATLESGAAGDRECKKDKKAKKLKSLGMVFRFGKVKKEDRSEQKSGDKQKVVDNKAATEEEKEKMRDEQERIQTKHREIRERQARELKLQQEREQLAAQSRGTSGYYEEHNPAYASLGPSTSPPALHKPPYVKNNTKAYASEDEIRAMYAKVNKAGSLPKPVPQSERMQAGGRVNSYYEECNPIYGRTRDGVPRHPQASGGGPRYHRGEDGQDGDPARDIYARVAKTSSLPRPQPDSRATHGYQWVQREGGSTARDGSDDKRAPSGAEHSRSQSGSEVRGGRSSVPLDAQRRSRFPDMRDLLPRPQRRVSSPTRQTKRASRPAEDARAEKVTSPSRGDPGKASRTQPPPSASLNSEAPSSRSRHAKQQQQQAEQPPRHAERPAGGVPQPAGMGVLGFPRLAILSTGSLQRRATTSSQRDTGRPGRTGPTVGGRSVELQNSPAQLTRIPRFHSAGAGGGHHHYHQQHQQSPPATQATHAGQQQDLARFGFQPPKARHMLKPKDFQWGQTAAV